MTTQTSISSSLHDDDWAYDVFINFRGEDTRYGFTGNLYDALNRKGIRTFFDGEEIRKGDELTPTLLKAIEESRMAICVFSRNYASSTFCLDELVHIHQCIKGKGTLVWPIFYEVEPSEVRHQKGIYEQALADHRIKNLANYEKKMQSWKLALREVANICGTHHNPRHGRYEYEVIEEIVRETSFIINRLPLYLENLVGVDYRLQQMNSQSQLGSNEHVGVDYRLQRINSSAINFTGEQPMLKKRRLMHVTSDSIRVYQGNNNMNNGYKASLPIMLPWTDHDSGHETLRNQETEQEPSITSTKDLRINLLQDTEYESKTQTIDIQSARRRANEGSVLVRRPEDEGVCWTQEIEALTNDDHQVTRQDYKFDSNGNDGLTWDPMECEYEGTSNNNNKDPHHHQRRDHPWTRKLLLSSLLLPPSVLLPVCISDE